MNRRQSRFHEAGFSLVEVLIGGLIFLVVVIGILPLFTRAMVDNSAGNDYTQVSNIAKSAVEEFMGAPFNSPQLTVPVGQEFLETKQLWDQAGQKWVPDTGTVAIGTQWRRTIRVRQYHYSDLTEDPTNPVFDHPKPGGTPVAFVNFKEIEVQVQNVAPLSAALGVRRQFTMRFMKKD